MRTLLAAMLVAGCSGDDMPGKADLAMDLSVPDQTMPDMAGGAIGDPCTANGGCREGKVPVCFRNNLFNNVKYLKTTDGYCSASCLDDSQCGANGVCIDEGSNGKWCFTSCIDATCRTGYACFTRVAGHCFPSGNLGCDPTAGDGTCMNGSTPGGCRRLAVGTGNTGSCSDGCDVGPGSCAPSSSGAARQCIVVDETGHNDLHGNPEMDKFKGPVCVTSYSMNSDLADCLYNGNHYLDACIDGNECYTKGDKRCHRLCHPPGAVDGGTDDAGSGDGGTVTDDGGAGDGGAGDGGATDDGGVAPCNCSDVYGLFGSKYNIGLCL